MKKKILEFISLAISSMILLYLLASNIFNKTFIFHDWIVISIDLIAQIIIQITIMISDDE